MDYWKDLNLHNWMQRKLTEQRAKPKEVQPAKETTDATGEANEHQAERDQTQPQP